MKKLEEKPTESGRERPAQLDIAEMKSKTINDLMDIAQDLGVQGVSGRGLGLDGIDDKVQVPEQLVTRVNLTLNVWIKTSDDVFAIISGANSSYHNEYLVYVGDGVLVAVDVDAYDIGGDAIHRLIRVLEVTIAVQIDASQDLEDLIAIGIRKDVRQVLVELPGSADDVVAVEVCQKTQPVAPPRKCPQLA